MESKNKPVVYYTGEKKFEPVYATEHAAGADLKADISEPLAVGPGERCMVPTGLKLAIPDGWEGQAVGDPPPTEIRISGCTEQNYGKAHVPGRYRRHSLRGCFAEGRQV